MEIRRITVVLWIVVCCSGNITNTAGIDIGESCHNDMECMAGNGGHYSECNKYFSVCSCTLDHTGEVETSGVDGVDPNCNPEYSCSEDGYCASGCAPKRPLKWKENEDWYGIIPEPFTSIVIPDKKTSVCYDPERAFNSLPDGLVIKTSTIPDAGLGIFAHEFIRRNTVFGPYKGILDPDEASAIVSGYSWKILKDNVRPKRVWIDAKDVARSNWMRYSNTPTSGDMENIKAIQYQGEMYYQVFKSVHPGTELLIWYGESYGEYLEIDGFEAATHYSAKSGYAGGPCKESNGIYCMNDNNAMCIDEVCFCKPGTHIRSGVCIQDETLGGICNRPQGDRCEHDRNAECERGVCVCSKGAIPVNGICIGDEALGGRCSSRDGDNCVRDSNAECDIGLCICKHGTRIVGTKCVKDESYEGTCFGEDGHPCDIGIDVECWDGTCVCKATTSAINGVCKLDGTVGGKCNGEDDHECLMDKNAECNDGRCTCKRGASVVGGKCAMDELFGGMCASGEGAQCKLDKRARCQNSVCVCMSGSTNINGTCMTDDNLGGKCKWKHGWPCRTRRSVCKDGVCACKDGTTEINGNCVSAGVLYSVCVNGLCDGHNVVCNSAMNRCVCDSKYSPHAGRCVADQ